MSKTIPPATTDLSTYGFPRAQCERIGQVVTRVEGEVINPVGGRVRYPVPVGNSRLIPLLLPTGILGGTYGSPGTASNVTILKPKQGAPGFEASEKINQNLYNPYVTAISGINKFAWGTRMAGRLVLVVGDC